MTDHYGKAAEALAAVQFSDLTPAESSAMAAATAQVHAILHLAAVIAHGGGEGYTGRPTANSTLIRFGPPRGEGEKPVRVVRLEAERRMAEQRERVGITVQEQRRFIEGFVQGSEWRPSRVAEAGEEALTTNYMIAPKGQMFDPATVLTGVPVIFV